MTSVTFGNGLTYLGAFAFENCVNLTSVTLPDSLSTLAKGVFGYCEKLESITFGSGLKTLQFGRSNSSNSSIVEDPFYRSGLKNIYYTGTLADWCTIKGFDYIINRANYNNAYNVYINGVLLEGDLVIPDGVTTIESGVFSMILPIRGSSITIPVSVTNIGAKAFSAWNLTYQGTKAQFRAIEGWQYIGEIECIDGTIYRD